MRCPWPNSACYIEEYVTDAISRIVEVDRGSVDLENTWRSLGVDSLMAVELRNRIEAGLHVSIPVETLQSETAIEQTVDTLLEVLESHESRTWRPFQIPDYLK